MRLYQKITFLMLATLNHLTSYFENRLSIRSPIRKEFQYNSNGSIYRAHFNQYYFIGFIMPHHKSHSRLENGTIGI